MTMRRLLALTLAAMALLAAPAPAAVKTLAAVPGAEVWLNEDHSMPVIAMTASLPAGSAYDPASKAGLAAMAARLLEEGAGRFEGTKFRAELDARAIRLTVQPGRDRMSVSLLVLSSDAPEAFRVLGLALKAPQFDFGAITRIRLAMMQEIDEDRADPSALAWDSFHSLYFGAHPYGHAVGGSKSGLAGVTRDDLIRFARRHWVRGGLKIAVSGDVSPAAASRLLQTAFGGLPAEAPPPVPAPFAVGAPGLHVMRLDASEPDAVFALPGLARRDPDFLAGLIANQILGGGENSRLTRNLRETRGLTYDVSTDLVAYGRAAVMVGEMGTRPADMRAALSTVRETMRRFALEGPTTQEFSDAKAYVAGSFPLSFTSNEDIAGQLVGLMENGLSPDYVARRAAFVNGIGIDAVRRAARRLYASDRITIAVGGTLPPDKRTRNTR
jgi:zinc protease